LNDERFTLISQSARRARRRDFLYAAAALGAGAAGAGLAGGADGGRALALCVGLAAPVLALRYWLGGRNVDAERQAISQRAPEGLTLATTEALIERLPDPLIVLDAEGRVRISNSASHLLIGRAIAQRHISAVLRAPEVLQAVDLVLAGAPAQSVEYRIPVPVERHILAYVASVPLVEGARPGAERPVKSLTAPPSGAIIVLHELTAQKRLEQMRADFVANASHELRTPLASLSGYIDTLRGHARDDAAARTRFLEIMSEQAGRMRRLIEDLLSLSRIELNEHVRPADEVDLGAVARDVLDGLAPQAAARQVKVDAEIAPGLPLVAGERDELVQVVQNLVDNAIKYGAAGGRVVVRVGAATPDAADARHAESNFVAIQDFGGGIAREHVPRLTERFYRVDVQRSRQTGGTGLGLAIVKHIVNRHRGWMSIESRVGEGSTFTVFLPWASRSSARPAAQPLPAESVA
jgi:two-component system phosphate regulon sensor histidine kinase PhoR